MIPESRPSPVRACTCPQIWNRSRMRLPILSRISDKSPPVCRCSMMAVQKNLRSIFGTRLTRLSSDSSRGIPRFCSSNTRPNSTPSGADISPDTILNPAVRLWPERRHRDSISKASGNCSENALKRLLRFKISQMNGKQAIIIDSGGIRNSLRPRTSPAPAPTKAITPHVTPNCKELSETSACDKSRLRLICATRFKTFSKMPGVSSRGCVSRVAFFLAVSFAPPIPPRSVMMSRRSSILVAGLSRRTKATPPTSAVTPINTTIPIIIGDITVS